MDALQIAKVKDDILKYIYKPERIENLVSIDELYNDLDIDHIPIVVLRGYLEEMAKEGLINYWETEEDDYIVSIAEDGERLIYSGGFIKQLQDQIAIEKQQEEDRQINRVKTKLEIDNLKLTKRISIIALIVSIISISLSVIF